jgi:putative two-component system response regulator
MEHDRRIKRILVVDDDSGHRAMTCKLLEEILAYSCTAAASAFEALEILDGSQYDLVLSDIIMEGKDGLELVSEARGKYPDIPCIIMTGYSSQYSYTDIIHAGADDFISKPFGVGELKAKIDRVSRERGLISSLEKVNIELKRAYQDLAARLEETINALASAMELRDPYTAGHQTRVADIACMIARALNMP